MRFSIRRWDLMMALAGLVQAKGVGDKNAEEALDRIEPRPTGRRVVETHLRIVRKPGFHVRRPMRRGVVEDHVQFSSR
jgi:tRNA U34 5-methylaminomethyl-2-thiouridine-forming methyltransferase MnmC